MLTKLADHRGFKIVKEYEDQGISGGKGRDKRPAFDQMLKDAMRRRFDVFLYGRWIVSAARSCTSPRRWRNWMLPVSR